MKKRIIIALVAALPTELVNFFVSPFPIDVGLPPDAGPFAQFMGTQWLILHYPGLLFSSRIDHFEHSGLMISTLLVSGYIDSALLIFLGIYLYRAIRRLVRRNSAASA